MPSSDDMLPLNVNNMSKAIASPISVLRSHPVLLAVSQLIGAPRPWMGICDAQGQPSATRGSEAPQDSSLPLASAVAGNASRHSECARGERSRAVVVPDEVGGAHRIVR